MDKHEYEINQLINPKKDIVKSNSKHRDNLETLILGRRIGGIVGGGDTPEKPKLKDNTYYLCALSMASGEYFGFQAIEEEENYFACELSVSIDEQGNNDINIYDSKGQFVRTTDKFTTDEEWETFVNDFVKYIDKNTEQAIYVENSVKIYTPDKWSII